MRAQVILARFEGIRTVCADTSLRNGHRLDKNKIIAPVTHPCRVVVNLELSITMLALALPDLLDVLTHFARSVHLFLDDSPASPFHYLMIAHTGVEPVPPP